MRTNANWARMVVAVFTMAVFYAAVCSTTCTIGFCPDQVQQKAAHDCDQTPSHRSDQSRPQPPDNPDCSQHQHPGLFITKSGDVPQFQLSVVGHSDDSIAAVSSVRELVVSFTAAEASEHDPPNASKIPLYQQISVLRI